MRGLDVNEPTSGPRTGDATPGGPPISFTSVPPTAQQPPGSVPPGRRTRKALEALAKAEQRQAKWEAAAAAKRAELADLERRIGSEVLAADDDQADAVAARLTDQIARLRGGLEVDDRARTEAAAQVVQARRVVLQEEAADLREPLEDVRRRKADHDRKLQRLLAQLSELDGARYVPWEPTRAERDAAGAAPLSWSVSVADLLGREVADFELRVEIADTAARGESLVRFVQAPPELSSPRVKGPAAFFPALALMSQDAALTGPSSGSASAADAASSLGGAPAPCSVVGGGSAAEERLARLRAGLPGPAEKAAREILERSPEVADLLGIRPALARIDAARATRG